MTADLEILLAGYKHWRDIGNDALIGGLIAEVAIIVTISEHWRFKWAFELLAGIIVLAGVWTEVAYGGYADEVEAQLRQKLETKLAWRTIAPEQLAQLLPCLKQSPKGQVFVVPEMGPEPNQYAAQILALLKQAGFDKASGIPVPATTLSWETVGVLMLIKSRSAPPSHAGPIQACFVAAGIPMPANDLSRWNGARGSPTACIPATGCPDWVHLNDVLIAIGARS
jgi:hypothetical protein